MLLDWSSAIDRRKFFEDYAKKRGFDPLTPENWYIESYRNVAAMKVFNELWYFLLTIREQSSNNSNNREEQQS